MSDHDWYEVMCLARWLAWPHGFGPFSVEVFIECQRLLEQ